MPINCNIQTWQVKIKWPRQSFADFSASYGPRIKLLNIFHTINENDPNSIPWYFLGQNIKQSSEVIEVIKTETSLYWWCISCLVGYSLWVILPLLRVGLASRKKVGHHPQREVTVKAHRGWTPTSKVSKYYIPHLSLRQSSNT